MISSSEDMEKDVLHRDLNHAVHPTKLERTEYMLYSHSAETIRETSSHTSHQGTPGHSCLSSLIKPLWTDPGLKSRNGVSELISTLKKKERGGGVRGD